MSLGGPTTAAALLASVAGAPLSYPEHGATAGRLPDGYDHVHRWATLGVGLATYDVAVTRLMSWQMHARAGLHVVASAPFAAEGVEVVLGLGVGPVGVLAPCRVVYVVREEGRAGYAYGTLPGHPEQGEEAFVVTLGEDGRVSGEVTAFSRPATLPARAGGPVTRLAQQLGIRRYLVALRP